MLDQISRWDAAWHTAYPKRITRKQKKQFLDELAAQLQAFGLATEKITVKKVMTSTNLVTKCDNPRVILMAHYDTPTLSPFWFSWLFSLFGHTRQILGMMALLAFLLLPFFWPAFSPYAPLFHLFIILTMLTLLIPNPHNREDNTSGVIGLMALAQWLGERPAIQQRVQLVFLDNEEWGLLGSIGLKQLWDKEGHPYQQAAIINLDCISRGQRPLLIYHKQAGLAQKLLPRLQKYLPTIKPVNMGPFPLSDNYTFRRQGAVDISYADPALIPGGYVIRNIHTPSDNDFTPENMIPLIHALTDYLQTEVGDDHE